VEELWKHVGDEWNGLDQLVIDTAIREWHKRLHACIAADEDIPNMQFERCTHLLKYSWLALEEEKNK